MTQLEKRVAKARRSARDHSEAVAKSREVRREGHAELVALARSVPYVLDPDHYFGLIAAFGAAVRKIDGTEPPHAE